MKGRDRLQGTDGVRRVARLSSDPLLQGVGPMEAFLDRGIMTEQFVELYVYGCMAELQRQGRLLPGGEVVIGWDPRDPTHAFPEAAIRGVRKGGARAVVAGMLPTPAVVLYLLYRQATAALVVTASHNPADQNGIKLFLGPLGLKPLPADDGLLTDSIHAVDWPALQGMAEAGEVEWVREEALRVFLEFTLDERNSWAKGKDALQALLLVVDPAYGTYAGIAAQALRELGATEVVEVNGTPGDQVNLNSGVGDLEGTAEVEAGLRVPSGRSFPRNALLKELFRLGRENRSACQGGKRQVLGVAFDADGDRVYLVLYDPFRDRLLILSGDESAFHQARYLISQAPQPYRGTGYLNTVESDLNAGLGASGLGYQARLTGVGDKWLLWQASFGWLVERLAETSLLQRSAEIRDLWERLSSLEEPQAFLLSELAERVSRFEAGGRRLEPAAGSPGGALPWEDALGKSLRISVANEESGHLITRGYLTRRDAATIPVFVGNGLKGAINTLVALRALDGEPPSPEEMERRHRPFAPGFKKTLYVYYTDKAQLRPGTGFRRHLEVALKEACHKILQAGEEIASCAFSEEPEMLYLGIFQENTQQAGVYIRNSGTEEKTAIYLRGSQEDRMRLAAVGEEVLRFLLAQMKDLGSLYAQAERVFLEGLHQGREPSGEELQARFPGLSPQRLIQEIEKQGLIQHEGAGWRLTNRGEEYLKASRPVFPLTPGPR
ncbi:MAG: hypothetical protein HYY20_00410 [Candidatus Tectomicrobia bacterium]|uniref:Alpha-D-phosphohexomutase alpha/beta/alpha domain-containing protein n=1 Tax=Tectimicrobiota bacterium TaxID=2528274 RepID=A0A932CLE6_UNCTE|nr:hypothetical protein [Candidatus Tectomicrobia bacterium]